MKFEKTKLTNLNYSLSKELIRSNRSGSYSSTTIPFCNTRKYHGLLVCPCDEIDGEWYVLLSALDETVIQREREFHLALRKYPGTYAPQGHKYLRDFHTDPIPTHIYRVGGVILKKEALLSIQEERILIRYTLLDAHSPTYLRLQPFFAYRQRHQLSKANFDVLKNYEPVENGIKYRMYYGLPALYLQISKKADYVHAPDWYYNVEYEEEKRRGYEYHEDLYSTGFFEFKIEKGESVVFSAGKTPIKPNTLKRKFTLEIKKRVPRTSMENDLKNAAEQFFMKKGNKTYVIAGFPWFGVWARDTFIALPGLTIPRDDFKTAKQVLMTMSEELRDGMFPNAGTGENADVNSIDAPLWYIWAIQKLYCHTNNITTVKPFWKHIKKILETYRVGTVYNIGMRSNYLIAGGVQGKALTWMDAIVDGKPVTPRIGYPVEINALWYNDIKFALEIAEKLQDTKFIEQWKDFPEKIKENFLKHFYNKDYEYLADYLDYDLNPDFTIRPNQVIATSLPYTMLKKTQIEKILKIIEQFLLTPKGLRTLSPQHPDYIGVYEGDQRARDLAYHQGTVWTWLLGHYVEGYLKIHKKSGLRYAQRIYNNFKEEMTRAGIGTISEIFDGDPPHNPKGAISQAWSVAEVLRIKFMIDNFEKCFEN